MTSSQQSAFASSRCKIVFANLTRQLYATDASPYQIEPAAVAFPRHPEEARDVILAADAIGIAVSPRGA